MNRRSDRIYAQMPEPVSGMEINPERGLFSVIIPEATTNLVTNPSVEFAVTTGYTTYGGAMAATYDWQAFGAGGLKLTPAVSTESGFYYGTVSLTAALTYTASVVIQGEAGKKYYIWFATTAGALLGTKRLWIGTGHKQRIWVTYTETSTTTRRIYVARDGQYPDQNLFYADGLQVEAKSYPTTYCDGDQVGFVVNQVAYNWNGEPRASTSTRSVQTRSGGREMNLLDYGFRLLAVIGLGMPMLVDQSLPIPGVGELVQGTGTQAREFSLVGEINADSVRHLQSQRADLIAAFNPFLTDQDQPLVLRYQNCDEDGEQIGESMDILCKYRGGLEGNWDNPHGERIALNFKQYVPTVRNTYDSGVSLSLQTTIANANYMIKRVAGTWDDIGTGATGSVPYAFLKGLDGYIYIVGSFTNLGGVANTRGIGRYDPIADTFSAMGTGADAGNVYAIVQDAAGNIYAGGTFSGMGGVANTAYFAKWNGAAWVSMGDANGVINALAIRENGAEQIIYAGGNFTSIGGGTLANRIAKVDLKTGIWYAIGLGANDEVLALAFNLTQDRLFVGGSFTSFDGEGLCKYICQLYRGIYSLPMYTAGWAGLNNIVRSMVTGSDGKVYIGGWFTNVPGVSNSAYVVRWTGSKYESLGAGLISSGGAGSVYSVKFDQHNNLYIGGTNLGLMSDDPSLVMDNLFLYSSGKFQRLNIDLPGAAPTVYGVFEDIERDTLYLSFSISGNAVVSPANTANIGDLKADPMIMATGPGYLEWIENTTTKHRVYFNYQLQAGERITINLDPIKFTAVSNIKGNILPLLNATLDFDLNLIQGSNTLRASMMGTTAASSVVMYWKNQFLSLDTGIWK